MLVCCAFQLSLFSHISLHQAVIRNDAFVQVRGLAVPTFALSSLLATLQRQH